MLLRLWEGFWDSGSRREHAMPEVLVVGGAGYVGSVLVGDLVSRGSSVRVVDRLFFGVKPLEEMLDRIELIQMDMRELDESDLRGVSAVVNIAGLSNDPMAETYPEANDQLNAREAVRLAEVAKAAGVSRDILASSCALYD